MSAPGVSIVTTAVRAAAGPWFSRTRRPVLLAPVATIAALALWCGTSSAAYVHPFLSSFGSFSNVQGIAVDSSTGDVYVYDGGNGEVLTFDASGNPAEFAFTKTNAITGVGGAEGDEGEIAVDNSSGPAKGDIYVAHASGSVNIYSSEGKKLGELTEEAGDPWGEACGVAVDSSGNVYVGLYAEHINKYVPSANPATNADYASSIGGVNEVCNVGADSLGNAYAIKWNSGPVTRYETNQFGSLSPAGSTVDANGSSMAVDPANDEVYVDEQGKITQFGANGEPFEEPVFTFASSGAGAISGSIGIAVSGFDGDVYVSDGKGGISVFGRGVVVPDVVTGAASSVQSESATVSGTVNPLGAALTKCDVEYGLTVSYGQSAACVESPAEIGTGSGPVEVHVNLTGLTPDTAYHYRLVATNADGVTKASGNTFHTSGPPVVTDESVFNVARTEADVSAQINPDFGATAYHVEYGATNAYGSRTVESAPLVADKSDHTVTAHISGLTPGTTYHLLFVATNNAGIGTGTDTAFTTYLPTPVVAGGCPNEARRQEQNATYLPDCRAYEMVSPLDKNGSDIVGQGRNIQVSASGDRIGFPALAGFGDVVGSGVIGYTQYLAEREDGKGWISHGVTPTPANESFQFLSATTSIPLFSEAMDKALVQSYDLPAAGDDIPHVVNLYVEDADTRAVQSVTKPLEGETYSPFMFESVPTGASADMGVVTLQTKSNLLPGLPAGEKLYEWSHGKLSLAGVLPDGTTPAGGSGSAGQTDFQNLGTLSHDGSRVLFSAPVSGPGQTQLYMRRDGSNTVWVSQSESSAPLVEPHEVHYQSMSPDGTKVLFTSSDMLTDSDPGGPGVGLYLYTDSPHPETESNLSFIGRLKALPPSDENIVTGTSIDEKRIYFYTEATVGFAQRGIYLWDNGSIRFVAPTVTALVKGPGPSAAFGSVAEVSADGRRLAFIAREKLTEAPVGQGANRTLQAMYFYDESADTLRCVSCLPSGAATTSDVEVEPDATHVPGATVEFRARPRFFSDDGRYAFFSTADALVAQDTNDLDDVYEYDVETGTVSLLSSGTGDTGAWFVGSSSNGRDAFFLSRQSFLAQDIDSLVDVYDVRVGGGLPQPQPQTGGCVGDECQATPTAAPGFNTASGFSGLGNAPRQSATVGKSKTKKLTRAQKLTRALKACKRKRSPVRHHCEVQARKRFRSKSAGKSTSHGRRR